MKNSQKILSILLFLFIYTDIYSQEIYQIYKPHPCTIQLLDGTVITGEVEGNIDRKNGIFEFSNGIWLTIKNEEVVFYKMKKIKSYTIYKNKYTRKITSKYRKGKMMKVHSEGDMSLYSYVVKHNNYSTNNYYFTKTTTEHWVEKNGKIVIIPRIGFKKAILKLVSDKEHLVRLIKEKHLKYRHLKGIIDIYNNTTTYEEYYKNREETENKKGVKPVLMKHKSEIKKEKKIKKEYIPYTQRKRKEEKQKKEEYIPYTKRK